MGDGRARGESIPIARPTTREDARTGYEYADEIIYNRQSLISSMDGEVVETKEKKAKKRAKN